MSKINFIRNRFYFLDHPEISLCCRHRYLLKYIDYDKNLGYIFKIIKKSYGRASEKKPYYIPKYEITQKQKYMSEIPEELVHFYE